MKIIFLLALFSISCSSKAQEKETATNTTTEPKIMFENLTLEQRIEELKKAMIEYMKFAKPSYTEKEINECTKILTQYISDISKTNSKDEAMSIVKSTVLQLNELNEKTGLELIETEERERIADIIIAATHAKGYNAIEEDVTEEWREW